MPLPLSILDLAFIGHGETARDSLEGSVVLAQHAERAGYNGPAHPGDARPTADLGSPERAVP